MAGALAYTTSCIDGLLIDTNDLAALGPSGRAVESPSRLIQNSLTDRLELPESINQKSAEDVTQLFNDAA